MQTSQLFSVSINTNLTCFNPLTQFPRESHGYLFCQLKCQYMTFISMKHGNHILYMVLVKFNVMVSGIQFSFTSLSPFFPLLFHCHPVDLHVPCSRTFHFPIMLLCQNPQETLKHRLGCAWATESWWRVMWVRSVSLLMSVHNSCDEPTALAFTLDLEYKLKAN